MKFFKKNKKEIIFAALIILLAALTRFLMLGQVPISLSDDEIRQVYSAYSIFHTGKDVYGNFLPLIFNIDSLNYGPVSIYISSLFFVFMKLSIFSGRLPYALFGALTVISVYFLTKSILKNSCIGFISATVLAISVWQIQISRLAHDASFALFFYVLGITLFTKIKKNELRNVLLAMFVLFLGFYSYAATRVIFIPFLIILIWYKFKDLNKKHIYIIVSSTLLIFGLFAYLSLTQKATEYGTGPFFFMDKSNTALQVELERRGSQEPSVIKTIYHNKVTYWYKTFVNQYSYAFSPQFLFTSQEGSGIYSIWGRGELYSFEIILIFLGAIYLILKKRKEFIFILLMLLAAVLPSGLGINSPTYFTRSELMIPFLYILVASGVYAISYFVKNIDLKRLLYLFLVCFYIYAFGGYLFQYYYDWSRTNAKYYSKSTQDLVYKINFYRQEGKQVIVSSATDNTFLHYAFYNKLDPRLVQENINKSPIIFNNIIFQKNCLLIKQQNVIFISSESCNYHATPSAEIKTYDNSETIWKIYEN